MGQPGDPNNWDALGPGLRTSATANRVASTVSAVTQETGNLAIEAQARYRYIEQLLLADFPPPAKIVELGAAPGDQIAHLAGLGYEATSVDIGDAADEWGGGEQGRMARLLSAAGVEDITWNLEEVPYPLPDATFDAVLMTEVYEHLRDYPVKSLEETFRILKPGGRLYFTTPNAAYLVSRFRALAGHSTATPLPDWIGGLPHARHAREYTFFGSRRVDAVGWAPGGAPRVSTLPPRRRPIRVGCPSEERDRQLAKWRPTLGPQIIVVAERPA